MGDVPAIFCRRASYVRQIPVMRLVNALVLVVGTPAAFACTDIPTDSNAVLAIAFDSLPSPSVVLGDTLRDTTGVAAPLRATVFNFQGEVISAATVTFSSPDRGVRVDGASGFVVADSLRATPARILATVGNLQSVLRLDVSLRPDTAAPSPGRDSLAYSLTDTTVNVSPSLNVRVLHGLTTAHSAVRSYIVSFAVTSAGDGTLARLVNDAGRSSRVDTTDANGIAGRKIRLDPARLSSLVDSVIVQATVKYRGAQIRGSPVRLVLKVRPATP